MRVPTQIRVLREHRGWTQQELADKTRMLQPRISAMEHSGGSKLNLETLRRVASAFDCGLLVRFVPFSELARWFEEFDPENFSVPAFDHDSFTEQNIPDEGGIATHSRGNAQQFTNGNRCGYWDNAVAAGASLLRQKETARSFSAMSNPESKPEHARIREKLVPIDVSPAFSQNPQFIRTRKPYSRSKKSA